MKRSFGLILIMVIIVLFTACGGNYAQINLKETISIPENGIIEKEVIDKIKEDNAIATFSGVSNGIKYEWTIFGSDLETSRQIDLAIDLKEVDNGIKISFNENEDFGFPILLSIHLNEKWDAIDADAYHGDNKVYSVSITGSKTSILNISVNNIVDECVVIPNKNINQENDNITESESIEEAESNVSQIITNDDYLSDVENGDNRVYSDGNATDQDEYNTDPVPEGKPLPVEPEEQEVSKEKTYSCTFSIECSTILNNLEDLDPDKLELVPSNGIVFAPTKVTFYEGESVFDVLQRVCKENNIHLESSWTPIYNSAYVEGINNLYEFDCGELSGWMYRVNGWYPNYGCSRYQLVDGENVEWRFTCDLGKDVGCDWMG